jgi:hypothetical protein
MEKKVCKILTDNYVVNIKSDGTSYYFKNGLLHRENGPAITNPLDKDKYLNLSDETLYIKEITSHLQESTYLEEDDLGDSPVQLFIATSYYLNGMKYSKEEFIARKLKKELILELFHNQGIVQIKKTKV